MILFDLKKNRTYFKNLFLRFESAEYSRNTQTIYSYGGM